MQVGANNYFNGSNYIYSTSNVATRYAQSSGQHLWFTSSDSTPTAGNTISFTQAMTLDASGNLGVGTTSPTDTSFFTRALDLNGTSGAGFYARTNGSTTNYTLFGNYGVDGYINNRGAGAIQFYNNGSERARITSGGDLLVGTTTYGGGANVAGFGANPVGQIAVERDGGAAGVFNRFSSDGNLVLFRRQGTTVGSIDVTTTATAYVTSSDYRLKNITGPITNSGAYIDSLNPVEGTWKADGSTFVGLIAHEVQEASRTPVATGTKDGEEMQGMDYSSAEIIANLIAEVKSLRARVAALESQA
jgi:hypothetical protein